MIEDSTITFGWSGNDDRSSEKKYEIESFDFKRDKLICEAYPVVTVADLESGKPRLSTSTFGELTKYSTDIAVVQEFYDRSHRTELEHLGISEAEYRDLLKKIEATAQKVRAERSGGALDWETNARGATTKLLQGRTDLTQDEVDAFKQSEYEYDASH